MASTWGSNSWGDNSWQSDVVPVPVTSPGTISALETPEAFNVEGWGRQAWNNSGWGVEYSEKPTGQEITSSLGTATAVIVEELTGFDINVNATFPTVAVETIAATTGLQISSSIGEVEASNFQGWGRQEWGISGWGVEYTVEPTGLEITSSLGSVTAIIVEELSGFDISNLIGCTAKIEVGLTKKSDYGDGGNPKILALREPKEGVQKVETHNDKMIFDLDVYCDEFRGKSSDESKVMCDIFESLPEWHQRDIDASYELIAAKQEFEDTPVEKLMEEMPPEETNNKDDFKDDNIPF